MNRRSFLEGSLGVAAARAEAAAPLVASPIKITRVRVYEPPRLNPTFNQANLIVTVETDAGVTGIGEGGSKQMLEQCAGMVIGEDPMRTEYLWQLMFRGFFYPAGREKLHALGALDVALWDIKGKVLNAPVHKLLGGLARNHLECYSGALRGPNLKESAQAVIAEGFRAFRTALSDYGPGTEPPRERPGRMLDRPAGPDNDGTFRFRSMLRQAYRNGVQIREGVGPEGDWNIDAHTRLDITDAVRLCSVLEPLEPLFIEDPLRSEAVDAYRTLRPMVKTPLAVGEQFGARWEFNKLIEEQLIDYLRATIPNVGGITEWMKISALCETHMVGLVPHGTGPISTAALVHTCGTFSGPVIFERGGGPGNLPYLPQSFEFKQGKVWPNQRPGLGVEFEPNGTQMIAEIVKPSRPISTFFRPDGSLTNW